MSRENRVQGNPLCIWFSLRHLVGMNVNLELRKLARSQYGLVGRRQAQFLGLSTKEISHRIHRGDFEHLSAEVLRLAGSPVSEGSRLMAGVLDAPSGAVASHRSAAAWWGIPGFSVVDPIHVTVPRQGTRARRRLSIVHFHKAFPLDQVTVLLGVPTSSPALTVFQLAACEHPARVERALDSAWSMRLLDGVLLGELLERLAARGRNGIRTMRDLLAIRGDDYIPPESGNEARFEWILKQNGLPVPSRQVVVGGLATIGRVDYMYEKERGVVEILSRRYHSSKLDSHADRVRFERLAGEGFSVLTLWDYELWEKPNLVASKVRAFLDEVRHPASGPHRAFSRDIPTL